MRIKMSFFNRNHTMFALALTLVFSLSAFSAVQNSHEGDVHLKPENSTAKQLDYQTPKNNQYKNKEEVKMRSVASELVEPEAPKHFKTEPASLGF